MSEKMRFEEILETKGELVYSNRGNSMWPLIRQGKDLMVIQKRPVVRLQEDDAVLYIRDKDGAYVMHRILKVREKDYVIRGDNCIANEIGIREDQIIGVLTGVLRNGKKLWISESFGYKTCVLYSKVSFPFRVFWNRLKRVLRPIYHKWKATIE